MKMRHSAVVGALGVLALGVQGARANSFAGTTSAVFGTPVPSVGNAYNGVGTGTITLGTGVGDSAPNSLTLSSENFNTPESTDFAVSGLTYFNGQTTNTTNDITLPVDLTFDFSNPAGVIEAFSFSFNLQVTPNSASPLSNPLNDDILTVPTSYAPQSFSAGGTDYFLKLVGFSSNGGNTIQSTFDLPEEDTAKSTLYGQITPIPPASATPLPKSAFGGLISLGLLACAKLRRRRAFSA